MVDHVLAEQRGGSGRDDVPASRKVRHDAPPHGPRGRIEPERFGEHLAREWQHGQVGGGGQPIAQYLLELLVEAFLHLGVLRQQIERPGQGDGRGFVAGKEQGRGLVADLLVRHPHGAVPVLLVPGGQEHRQEVAAVAGGPAVADQPEHDLVQ